MKKSPLPQTSWETGSVCHSCVPQEPLSTRGLVEDPVQAGPLELCLLPVSAEKAKGWSGKQ